MNFLINETGYLLTISIKTGGVSTFQSGDINIITLGPTFYNKALGIAAVKLFQKY